jgi:AAA domain
MAADTLNRGALIRVAEETMAATKGDEVDKRIAARDAVRKHAPDLTEDEAMEIVVEAAAPGLKLESDLATLARGERETPRQVVDGLLVARRIHLFIGHPANGKTTLAMFAALQHMLAGGDVLWIDWEETPDDFVDKALAVGITPEQLEAQMNYAWKPDLQANAEGTADLLATIERIKAPHDGDDSYPGVLVVFDSMDMALTIAGFDPDNRGENTKWAHYLTHPAKAAGATVIVIDAPTKNGNEKNPYPAGAGSKLFQADAAWFVKAAEPFKRDKVGKVEVIRPAGGKERTGTLPEKLVYEIGDAAGGLPLTRVEVDEDGEVEERRDMAARRNVANTLRKHSDPDRKISGRQVEENTKGRKSAIADALKDLVADPGEPFFSAPVGRGTGYWFDPESSDVGLSISDAAGDDDDLKGAI